MIIEFLLGFCAVILNLALDALGVFSLPLNLISTLATITGFGAYVIGADLLVIFCGCVFFWSGVKLVVGFALFIWDLLPLT